MVVPHVMKFLWRQDMGKEADLLVTITFGVIFWVLGEHEPLTVAFFLYIVFFWDCRGPWTVRGS